MNNYPNGVSGSEPELTGMVTGPRDVRVVITVDVVVGFDHASEEEVEKVAVKMAMHVLRHDKDPLAHPWISTEVQL